MAISDTEKLDFLWKKVLYGVSKTATSTAKFGSNETVASPLPVYNDRIWAQTTSEFIPATAPVSTTATVSRLYGANRVRMTPDVTSAANVSWLATTTYNDLASRIGDFIPPTFGTSYAVRAYIGDPNVGPAARIYPDTTNEEWVFDYMSGTLTFTGTIPAGKTATVGSGTVSVSSNGVYIEVFRYIGVKGLSIAGQSSNRTYIVADITARDALTGLSAGDMIHVQDASGIGSDAGNGEYANYLFDGTGFKLVSTEDSARSDALTQSFTLTSSSVTSVLGKIGSGTRVVSVTIEVTSAFDGNIEFAVGDQTVSDRLMTTLENDPQQVGTYQTQPSYRFPYSSEADLKVTVTGSATTGTATLIVTYA